MPSASPRTVRPVVFVEGVRTPFGRARADGLYAVSYTHLTLPTIYSV